MADDPAAVNFQKKSSNSDMDQEEKTNDEGLQMKFNSDVKGRFKFNEVTMEPQPQLPPVSERRNESFQDVDLEINDQKDKRQYSSYTLPGENKKKSLGEKIKNVLGRNKVEETFGARFSASAHEIRGRRLNSINSVHSEGSNIGCPSKTFEMPPMIDFYRHSLQGEDKSRPTMKDLIRGSENEDETIEEFEEKNAKIVESQLKFTKNGHSNKIHPSDKELQKTTDDQPKNKYGWIQGVLIRCVANIFGVMLFLRMSWVAGQAGILMGSMIVCLASTVTTITALSMSAISTNGLVKGGGAYYLISRSLGPEFGGSIGVLFSIANAVGAAMHIVGFAETCRDLMVGRDMTIFDGGINDVRVIGLITCVILISIVFIGLDFESKMQLFLIIIIFAALADFYIGSFIPPDHGDQLMGITGYSWATFQENLYPSFRLGYNYFSVFGIYFPAATGIMAGANISGDLKNPGKAIPKGTLLAIAITTSGYLSLVWITGASVVRDADGINVPELLNTSMTLMNNGWWPSMIFTKVFGKGYQNYYQPECVGTSSCKYGLMNNFQIVDVISVFAPLVFFGMAASSLSSALLCLVSGPKIFQAICKDKIFPYISYFATGYGKNLEPRKAYFLCFIIACLIIGIGDLNTIAPIISNFYLCTYALINFACFDTSFAKSPGFRPSFKYYNLWVSLIGALLCICIMFVISWFNALLTFMFFGLLFLYMTHRKPDVNWGSSTQAHSYRHALQYVQKLEGIGEHVKNYRPQILVLTGNPAARPSFVDFAYAITKGNSLLICGHVVPYSLNDSVHQMMNKLREQLKPWFRKRHIKSFYMSVANTDFRQGIQSLIQSTGLGRLKPNILLIGFKQDWASNGVEGLNQIKNYFGAIQDAFSSELAVCILRNGDEGLDFSEVIQKHNLLSGFPKIEPVNIRSSMKGHFRIKGRRASLVLANAVNFNQNPDAEAAQTISRTDSVGEARKSSDTESSEMSVESSLRGIPKHYNEEQVEVLTSINKFQFKVKKGTIDVWWLYDDGGLSLLIPYLLTQGKSYLEHSNLRVFTLSSHSKRIDEQERNLASLLTKFRIDCAEVTVLSDYSRAPSPKLLSDFEDLITPFIYDDTTSESSSTPSKDGLISKTELISQQERTWKTLRTAEQLQKYSSKSDLIVITLPVPRKGLISGCLYMAWLDVMTRGLPPTLFVRGNQQSVLTFYS